MNNKRFTKARIIAVASALPKKKMKLSDLAGLYGQEYIERVTKSTGIREVTVAEENMTSADYCYEAALKLFENVNISPADIDGLLFLSETPDYIIPNTAAILQHRLGIPQNTINMDLRIGCAGYIYGLFQASMLIECGYCKNVLLLAGDTMSKYINDEDKALRMVLGDAACATLISAEEDSYSQYAFYVDGGGAESLIIPAGGCRMPCEKGITDVVEYDEDGGGRSKENIYMNGMDVMVFATRVSPKLIGQLLEDIDWNKDEVDLYALHQANKMIIDRIVKLMKLDKEKVPFNVENTGNCGFVSIPLHMCTYMHGINQNLKKVVTCGFGTGLIASAGALDLSKTLFIQPIIV